MIFVKPFFTQLRWTASGDLEEQVAITACLPTWPLRIFSPVLYQHEQSVLFGPHLFGIDTLINSSLAGFNISDDFALLLEHQLLSLQTFHSLLVISISSPLKLEIQRLFRHENDFTTTAAAWRLCLHCIPDPHAEALWRFNYNSLQPLIVTDVLPMLAILDDEYLSSFSIVGSYTTVEIISRALLAYTSATTSDAIYVYGYISPSFFWRSSIEIVPFRRLADFLGVLTELVLLLDTLPMAIPDVNEDVNEDVLLEDSIKVHVQSLLGVYRPFGHLVLLNSAWNSNDPRSSKFSVKTRSTLLTALMLPSNKRSFDRIDVYLEAALLSDHKLIYHDATGLADLMSMNAVAHISFQCSQVNMFSEAISGFEAIMEYLQRDQRSCLQLWLVVACELMQCFNAIGYEDSAMRVIYSTLSRLRQDAFFHPLMHLRPALKLKLLDFEFLTEGATLGRNEATELAKLPYCRPPVHITLDCLLCGRLACETCRIIQHLTQDGGSAINSSSSAARGKLLPMIQESATVSTTSLRSTLEFGVVNLMYLNFEVLVNLRIILSDAFIGKGNYAEARQMLETLLNIKSVVSNESICLIYLRLNKIMRRENASKSTDTIDEKATAMMLNDLSEVAAGNRTFCFDEIESTLLQIPYQEGLADLLYQTLPKWQQQYPGDDDRAYRVHLLKQHLEAQTRVERGDSGMIEGARLDRDSYSEPETDLIARFKSDHDLESFFCEPDVLVDPIAEEPSLTGQDDNEATLTNTLMTGANAKKESQSTGKSLHDAAREGDEEMVQILLDRGADIEAKGNDGRTPLHQAADYGHEKVVQLLLDRSADIEAKDNGGRTPLHRAAIEGREKVVQLLLDRGADIEAKDAIRQTPLHIAAAYIREKVGEKVVQLLLDTDADIEAKDVKGKTPLHMALHFGNKQAAQMLKAKGARITPMERLELALMRG